MRFSSPGFLRAALIVSLLCLSAPARTENVGQVSQPLVVGKTVDPSIQEDYGLVLLANGGSVCSGSLLNNSWAVTAAHCVDNPNPAASGTFITVQPSAVTLSTKWNTPQSLGAAEIITFRPIDVAIIRVTAPFVVHGSTEGFKQTVWGDGPYTNLPGSTIQIFGRGINQFATSISTSVMDSTYRYGTAGISSASDNRYWFSREGYGPAIADGDSGGPSFVTLRVGPALTGVHSLCTVTCVQGKICSAWPGPGPAPANYSPWTWVANTPSCADAPIEPVWAQISQLIRKSSAAPAGPQQFIGTFSAAPATDQPIWLYALKGDGSLMWYRKDSAAAGWQGPVKVGNGWNFKQVIAGSGSAFYAITDAGGLKWYQHRGFNNGAFDWGGPVDVATGWNAHLTTFSGGDGVLYTVEPSGQLSWRYHEGYLTSGLGLGAPRTVSTGGGWDKFTHLFSMGLGTIYAVTPDGQMLWYRHNGYKDGSPTWTGPVVIGSGWNSFTHIAPVGGGVILAVKPDGSLWWYRHNRWNSEDRVSDGGPADRARLMSRRWEPEVQVGSGWQGLRDVVGLLPSQASSSVVR